MIISENIVLKRRSQCFWLWWTEFSVKKMPIAFKVKKYLIKNRIAIYQTKETNGNSEDRIRFEKKTITHKTDLEMSIKKKYVPANHRYYIRFEWLNLIDSNDSWILKWQKNCLHIFQLFAHFHFLSHSSAQLSHHIKTVFFIQYYK